MTDRKVMFLMMLVWLLSIFVIGAGVKEKESRKAGAVPVYLKSRQLAPDPHNLDLCGSDGRDNKWVNISTVWPDLQEVCEKGYITSTPIQSEDGEDYYWLLTHNADGGVLEAYELNGDQILKVWNGDGTNIATLEVGDETEDEGQIRIWCSGELMLFNHLGEMNTVLSGDGSAAFNMERSAYGDFNWYGEGDTQVHMDSEDGALTVVAEEYLGDATHEGVWYQGDGYGHFMKFVMPELLANRTITWWSVPLGVGPPQLVTLSSSGELGITAVPETVYSFKTIDCSSGTDPVADSSTDTLSLRGGTATEVLGSSGGDSATINWVDPYTQRARGYRNGSQDNLTNNLWTKVELNAETYDNGGIFDSVTNYRCTPGVAGYYVITGKVNFLNTIATKRYDVAIYVSGAGVTYDSGQTSLADYLGVYVSDIVYLTDVNYVELYARSMSGGNTVDINGGTGDTYLCLHRIS